MMTRWSIKSCFFRRRVVARALSGHHWMCERIHLRTFVNQLVILQCGIRLSSSITSTGRMLINNAKQSLPGWVDKAKRLHLPSL
mmetsp:Transcript_68894/g.199872  ORF Transcript_68894/g.199872 Transcript_68894/m.199872 type:complete len:84 (+) Transcript_68894:149-400(+)